MKLYFTPMSHDDCDAFNPILSFFKINPFPSDILYLTPAQALQRLPLVDIRPADLHRLLELLGMGYDSSSSSSSEGLEQQQQQQVEYLEVIKRMVRLDRSWKHAATLKNGSKGKKPSTTTAGAAAEGADDDDDDDSSMHYLMAGNF